MLTQFTKTYFTLKIIVPCLLLSFVTGGCNIYSKDDVKTLECPHEQSHKQLYPARIILNLTENPCKSQAVTWRTCQRVESPTAQISELIDSANLYENIISINADYEQVFIGENKSVYNYSAVFKNLKPDTIYSYRVGSDKNFCEWNQFKTAKKENNPFKFVYFGDPQNEVKSKCSRIFRSAFKKASDADFWLFVGDIVNDGENDEEWDDFFYGLGFIPRVTPMILLPGNHEYPDRRYLKGKDYKITHLWQPQFTLPENGPEGLKETVYYIDYQGTRLIMLNGNEKLEEQAEWLDKILSKTPQKWTIAAIHQPIYSTAKFRKSSKKNEIFLSVFDKHSVDLVLQGHDHTYSRTYKIKNNQRINDSDKGTVYVISVCGPKVYPAISNYKNIMAKAESGRQLFQVISVENDRLVFEAFDIKGDIYDSFILEK